MDRLRNVASHLSSSGPSMNKPGVKSPEDIVIVEALRTPICKAKRGGLKDAYPEELLSAVLKGILVKTRIDPRLVEDIQVGNVLPPGGGATVARMAMFHAGFPETSSLATVNRQCSSGLQAVANIAQAIMAGTIEIGIGAGVESMTRHYGPGAMPEGISEKVMQDQQAADSLIPMGMTSENVASKFGVSREKQDRFAVSSHQKAAAAQRKGNFKEEIVPVEVNGQLVSSDDGIRSDASIEGLAKLRPAFKEDGTTTAGNSSQVSDGAAAVLLMKRKTAQRLGLPVKAKFLSFATAGVPPAIMGIGPAVAIPKALEKAGLSIGDIGIFEINEAFASQAIYSVEKLGIDQNKVNPNGGAIALGHPLGCTGARQIATLLPEFKRSKAKFGVTSMCIGTGMGAAAVFENEQA